MSQWIHISAATDWTWSFPNEARGHTKGLQMMRKKDMEERDESSGESRALLSRPSSISTGCIFNNQKELFQSIYYILWHRRASDHEFYWLFMSLFYFHRVFVPPQASSSIHPSKWVHKAKHADPKFHSSYEKSWSFTPNSSKGFLFLLWYIVSSSRKWMIFCRGNRMKAAHTH